jgi:outer membrane protein insertion porin family
MAGNQISPNIMNLVQKKVKEYFDEKGFNNAKISVTVEDAIGYPNEQIFNVNVDRQDKVKVHRIYITGNEKFSERQIRNTMKKTNQQGDWRKFFSQKKFVQSDYKADLDRIIERYNELGYRDATILSDSVAPYDDKTVDVYISLEEGNKYYISDIQWVGNTVYQSDVLSRALDMHPGDVYNQKLLNKRLVTDEDAVSNAYLDDGYLFAHIVPIERNITNDSIGLEFRVIEGPQAHINAVNINGNDRVYEKVVRRELRVKPGDMFSKDDLMRSAREIMQMGHFDPETVSPDVKPNQEDGTVDIDWNLTSKASDQIELSLGWGQTGILGKVGLKFTNFSIKNLFHPSTYKGIVPQGEGQTFSISAQTNARYYQAYQVSFLDPWFGGKRPNALSVTGYYSRQTGVSSSYLSNSYLNSLYNYGYGYSYGYGSSYSSSSYYQNAYDPNQVLQMAGITVGFGKRLSWPDDYFTFNVNLSYNLYSLKNWQYLYYMENGVSNAIVLGLSLSRSNIDNPLYTRRGSTFSANLQVTPPASVFMPGRNWAALAADDSDEAKKERYKWIEYWKFRFNSRTYTPLTNPSGKYTLVLMTRADFGLLGSFNKNLKTPFETFYVGGDGMSGSYSYATETIGLRGYDNGSLTPYTKEGYAYTRFGIEFHFPFVLQPTTTIYGLAFAEAGNAWTSVSNFNPFSLRRSAGVGVRVYLPMVGLMGIDWAYGFDNDAYGTRGGSHFHFVLGQEF